MNAERKEAKVTEEVRREYGKVVNSAELNEIVLLSSSFNADRDYLRSQASEEDGGIGLNFHYGADIPEIDHDPKEGQFTGRFDWFARAEHEDHTAIDIRGSYAIVYASEAELDTEAVRLFVLRVGRFATFPYFRQLVSFYGDAGSLELPILPVLTE